MNFDLTDEHSALIDAAREALRRADTLTAARGALDGGPMPSVWQTATAAGWTGILVPEDAGGSGAGLAEALLISRECGRALAATHLAAHLPAVTLLAAADGTHDIVVRLTSGERRAIYVPATAGLAIVADRQRFAVSGTLENTVGAAGADVAVLLTPRGPLLVDGIGHNATVVPDDAFDPTWALGTVTFDRTPALPVKVAAAELARSTNLLQALLGAESLGAAEHCLESAREHAVNRTAFGRLIGSYQAIKHILVEMLRRVENARSLLYYAGWCWSRRPEDLEVTVHALRLLADDALNYAAMQAIFIHGAVGTTWEHDLSLYYRRAQLARRIAGGAEGAGHAVAHALINKATSEAKGIGRNLKTVQAEGK